MKTRSYEKELLDEENIPFADIVTTMKELNIVNTLLGGHAVTVRGLNHFTKHRLQNDPLRVAEIGSGGGDNLMALHRHAKHSNLKVAFTGVDIKPECIQFTAQSCKGDITWICSDYRLVNWGAEKPDIIFSSLFCHHFTDDELVEQLTWLRSNSKLGFFINDLHRHPIAYYSIRLLTRLFSKSHLVKNDGPLSVKRAFTKADWTRLLSAAGIDEYTISWHWAFRYLICVK